MFLQSYPANGASSFNPDLLLIEKNLVGNIKSQINRLKTGTNRHKRDKEESAKMCIRCFTSLTYSLM